MRTFVIAAVLLLLIPSAAQAQTMVTLDPATMTAGYMNVSNLPAPDGDGAYQFGSPWGFNDLVFVFDGYQLTLYPNQIGDPDPYWYIGGGGPGAPGNKIMEANGYSEILDGSLAGQTITFVGEVLSSTFTDAHTVKAFIRDFAPDFSSVNEAVIDLNAPGPFSFSLDTINDPARPVQWGIQVVGVNVWETDIEPFGTMVLFPELSIPAEESSFGKIKALYN